MSESPQSSADRIGKLEEAAGYSDHHIEILSGEIAELNKAMLKLSTRFAHLEARLTEINNRVGETPPDVPPPHSAGPDIPRDPL